MLNKILFLVISVVLLSSCQTVEEVRREQQKEKQLDVRFKSIEDKSNIKIESVDKTTKLEIKAINEKIVNISNNLKDLFKNTKNTKKDILENKVNIKNTKKDISKKTDLSVFEEFRKTLLNDLNNLNKIKADEKTVNEKFVSKDKLKILQVEVQKNKLNIDNKVITLKGNIDNKITNLDKKITADLLKLKTSKLSIVDYQKDQKIVNNRLSKLHRNKISKAESYKNDKLNNKILSEQIISFGESSSKALKNLDARTKFLLENKVSKEKFDQLKRLLTLNLSNIRKNLDIKTKKLSKSNLELKNIIAEVNNINAQSKVLETKINNLDSNKVTKDQFQDVIDSISTQITSLEAKKANRKNVKEMFLRLNEDKINKTDLLNLTIDDFVKWKKEYNQE
ncbi:Exonuclease sbcC [hydrothermal vent metagenome]|uniref:Exonuclease sbcC n=1 Tax=hydrothermal vent metagenome TaxID=652676 RepID=A0A1W1CME7_9ZZZZ